MIYVNDLKSGYIYSIVYPLIVDSADGPQPQSQLQPTIRLTNEVDECSDARVIDPISQLSHCPLPIAGVSGTRRPVYMHMGVCVCVVVVWMDRNGLVYIQHIKFICIMDMVKACKYFISKPISRCARAK